MSEAEEMLTKLEDLKTANDAMLAMPWRRRLVHAAPHRLRVMWFRRGLEGFVVRIKKELRNRARRR